MNEEYLNFDEYILMIDPPEEWKMPAAEQAPDKCRTSTGQVRDKHRTSTGQVAYKQQ